MENKIINQKAILYIGMLFYFIGIVLLIIECDAFSIGISLLGACFIGISLSNLNNLYKAYETDRNNKNSFR